LTFDFTLPAGETDLMKKGLGERIGERYKVKGERKEKERVKGERRKDREL
jgi:hypothetical protein